MLADHLVHHEADPRAIHLGDDDLLDVGVLPLDEEALPERDVGDQVIAHAGEVVAVRPRHVLPGELDALVHQGEREHEEVAADPHQEALDDGQGERDAHHDPGPLPVHAGDLYGAAQLVDGPLHHVHADPAPRDAGDLLRGGEAGGEDEREELLLGELGGGGDDAALDRLGPDRLLVQTRSVVLDGDEDAVSGMDRGEVHRAKARLAGGHPHLGEFHAVVDGIPDQVHQGIVQFLDDRLVQLGLGPVRGHLDLLAEFTGEIAHQPLELAEGAADRQHPDVERRVPELSGEPLHLLGYCGELRVRAPGGSLGEARLHRHQLPNQVHQDVEPLGGDPDAVPNFRVLLLLAHRLHVALLGQGRLHLILRGNAVGDRQFAETLLLGEHLLHLLGTDVAALQEDLPEFFVAFLGTRPVVPRHQVNFELAVVLHEDENVPYRVEPLVRGQDHLPADVA